MPFVITAETTTTTLSQAVFASLEYEGDVELINQLWWDQKISWAGGFDDGLQFWVDNNYPDMRCTVQDYMDSRFPDGPVEGLEIERLANSTTIELDEGWRIPGGKLGGAPAKVRVNVMSVMANSTSTGSAQTAAEMKELHVTILDGNAHFFFGCS